MTQLILRVINVIEVLSIYYAIRTKRQGDQNDIQQPQYQTDTRQPAPHSQQPEEQSESTPANNQNF
jgi:hypothetical protein